MTGKGELYCKQGMECFNAGQYEQAVINWIASYEAGYEKELVLETLYECFVLPNEQKFQKSYEKGTAEFSTFPYDACVLDFFPINDTKYYIYDREEQKFCGFFEMESTPVFGEKEEYFNVLYTDMWDIREIISNMKENGSDFFYLLLESVEKKFMSFFKLPHFKEIYLKTSVLFQSEFCMQFYFEESEERLLPESVVTENPEKYTVFFQEIVELRIERGSHRYVRETTNPLKCQIEEAAKKYASIEVIRKLAETYEVQNPMDYDLYILKAWLLSRERRDEEAYRMIQAGLKKNPYNFMANQIARMLCRKTRRYAMAVKYDYILSMLHTVYPYLPLANSWKAELEKEFKEYSSSVVATGNRKLMEKFNKDALYLEKHMEKCFGLDDSTYYGGGYCLVGTEFEDMYGNRKYNGFYDDIGLEEMIPELPEKYISWWVTKLECWEIFRTKHMMPDVKIDCLLPVLQKDNKTTYTFTMLDGRKITCRNKKAQHFEYYRLPVGTKLESEEELCIGNPIELKHNAGNKKMVLNIFVDGISQKVIEEEGLETLMPHTFAFFSEGVICSNAYTAGEWTLPAIASYMTGVSTVEHMLFHNRLTNVVSEDIPVLAEYFKEQGYQTAKIDGDWRSTQSYGYGRGIDRIIYQHQNMGMRVEQVVADVLDHMELMKETDQFIWMGCGDLHDIADGYSLRPSVQAGIPLERRSAEEVGETSVKQMYSENKREAYIKQMKHIDEYLAHIYCYLKKTYKDDEMVVSLFGDHGQGYLVKDGEHFLSEGRTKVAMMFRGGIHAGEVCEEIISVCDYLPILCKLAGIPLKDKKIEGNLPVLFGGKREREYAITDSIHPGDPYQTAIVSKDYVYYFTSGGVVEYDGRFELGEYSGILLDKAGTECRNHELKEYYFNLVMQRIGGFIIY